MGDDSIQDRICALVASQVRQQKSMVIVGNERFDELGFDVLDIFELIVKIEDAFMVEITDQETVYLTSVDETITFIQKKVASDKQA
jgi:acyl carrier protein